MQAKQLFNGLNIKNKFDDKNINIYGITINSDNVKQNYAYICINGTKVDGHKFAQKAKEKGASCLIVEKLLDIDIPQILVEDTRSATGIIASNFYGNPRKNFKLIGITGTNGKTTSTYMIKNIMECAGKKVGVIGTIGVVIGDKHFSNALTTPDPIELHKIFRQMADENVDVVVMEVSAHAIALQKINGLKFDVGILTNVTQDHLDFFGTFENYAKTKSDFIKPKYCKVGVVNNDDKIGKNIDFAMQNCKRDDFCVKSFGLTDAYAMADNIKFDINGSQYNLKIGDKNTQIDTKLIGKFNVYNAISSALACYELGVDLETIKRGLDDMDFVSGRINVIRLENGASVVIDYAHTPDGLQNILESVKEVSKGKVFCVFGCGGNRDSTKRPIMGEISGKIADFSILTSDNPRLERPEAIISDIEKGISKVTNQYVCITDRTMAINYVLRELKPNDVAVIAGKGAEDYLDIGGKKLHYSDFEAVEQESRKIFNEAQKC